jgi:hypothetical protein
VKPSEAINLVRSSLAAQKPAHDPLQPASSTVSRLAAHDGLLEIIQSVRRDPGEVERYAHYSLRHPLGHDKIVLLRADSEFELRIHAWWPDGIPRVEHVHHHRFGFASTVLRGQYEMQIFQLSPEGMPMTRYDQRTSANPWGWRLQAEETVPLQLLSTSQVVTGAGYTLSPEALHRVTVPPRELCLTLFLAVTGNADMSAGTKIFTVPGSTIQSQTPARPFTAAAYASRLDSLITELTS